MSRHSTTAGIDIGDKHSHLYLLDTQSGEVIEEGKGRTSPEAFERYFSRGERMQVAIEAGTHSPWISRLLERLGHEVLVAQTPGSSGSSTARGKRMTSSTQRTSPEQGAVGPEAARAPLRHRSEASQAHLALIRSRDALIRSRTQLVNHVRGTVKSFGERLPRCSAASFHSRVAGYPDTYRRILRPLSSPSWKRSPP